MPKTVFGIKLENYKIHRTDMPLKEIWSTLLLCTDINYLSKKWEDRSSEEYLYVSTSISQAYEYYLASKAVSLKTKPLLIYYSFLNLTKAVLYILQGKKAPDYHGLCIPNQGKTILAFSAKVNKGIFSSLAKYLGYNIEKEETFTLEDFTMNAIELSDYYTDYFQKEPKIIPLKPATFFIASSDGIEIHLDFDEHIIKNVPNLVDQLNNNTNILNDFDLIEQNSELKLKHKTDIFKLRYNTEDGIKFMERNFIYSIFADNSFYLNINDRKKNMPQTIAYYGIMYILGTIVRYHPEHIYELLDDKNTSVNWFVNKLCDTAERVYPNLIINLLYKSNIKYSPSF